MTGPTSLIGSPAVIDAGSDPSWTALGDLSWDAFAYDSSGEMLQATSSEGLVTTTNLGTNVPAPDGYLGCSFNVDYGIDTASWGYQREDVFAIATCWAWDPEDGYYWDDLLFHGSSYHGEPLTWESLSAPYGGLASGPAAVAYLKGQIHAAVTIPDETGVLHVWVLDAANPPHVHHRKGVGTGSTVSWASWEDIGAPSATNRILPDLDAFHELYAKGVCSDLEACGEGESAVWDDNENCASILGRTSGDTLVYWFQCEGHSGGWTNQGWVDLGGPPSGFSFTGSPAAVEVSDQRWIFAVTGQNTSTGGRVLMFHNNWDHVWTSWTEQSATSQSDHDFAPRRQWSNY